MCWLAAVMGFREEEAELADGDLVLIDVIGGQAVPCGRGLPPRSRRRCRW